MKIDISKSVLQRVRHRHSSSLCKTNRIKTTTGTVAVDALILKGIHCYLRSHKFERSSKQDNCKPAKIPDLLSLSEEAKQGSGELFVMPSTYLTPVQHMSNFVTLLRKCEDRHSQYPTDILLIHGSKGVGKSCFIKRVSGYFFERTRKDFELVYQ